MKKFTGILAALMVVATLFIAGCNSDNAENGNEFGSGNQDQYEDTTTPFTELPYVPENCENNVVSNMGHPVQNLREYRFDAPLPLSEIAHLMDDFDGYINYLASVRGMEAHYQLTFRFERLPGGGVVGTPLENVIARYDEMNEVLRFVSVGSHQFLGYLGRYNNGAEFVHIPLGSSIDAETNRWVQNDGWGNSFYYTPLMASFISPSSLHHFDNHIAVGRNLQASDGWISRDEPINIILGYAYKEIYELGDVLSLHYVNSVKDFQVVGFLLRDTVFYYGFGAANKNILDYRIIVPHFIPDFTPVGDAEVWQIAFHVGELLSGFIAIEAPLDELHEASWLYYQAIIEQIAERHGLSDIIGIPTFPVGIVWP